MTKRYIAFKDDVLPVSGYASTDEGKIAKVVQDGSAYKLEVVSAGSSSVGWSDVTDKPFQEIGAGLTVITDTSVTPNVKKLTADTQLHFEIFATLPTASSTYKQTIGLVAMTSGGVTQNAYKEYACVKTSDSPETWAWELLGAVEATVSQTADKITINGVEIQKASASQIGLISKDDYGTFYGKQDKITSTNKLSADLIASGSTNVAVSASEKASWDGKQSALSGTSGSAVLFGASGGLTSEKAIDTSVTASSTNLITSGAVASYAQPKVDAGTAGNLMGFSGTAGSIATVTPDSAISESTKTSTNPVQTKAVYDYAVQIERETSAISFKIGCDDITNGPYIDY